MWKEEKNFAFKVGKYERNRSFMFHGRCIYVCIRVHVYIDMYGYTYISSSIPSFELWTVLLGTKDKVGGRLWQIHGYKHDRYMDISIYVCIYIHICMFMYTYVSIYIYLCEKYTYVHIHLYIYIYIYMYTFTYCHVFDSVDVCVYYVGSVCVLCIPIRYVTWRIGPCLKPNS